MTDENVWFVGVRAVLCFDDSVRGLAKTITCDRSTATRRAPLHKLAVKYILCTKICVFSHPCLVFVVRKLATSCLVMWDKIPDWLVPMLAGPHHALLGWLLAAATTLQD